MEKVPFTTIFVYARIVLQVWNQVSPLRLCGYCVIEIALLYPNVMLYNTSG